MTFNHTKRKTNPKQKNSITSVGTIIIFFYCICIPEDRNVEAGSYLSLGGGTLFHWVVFLESIVVQCVNDGYGQVGDEQMPYE